MTDKVYVPPKCLAQIRAVLAAELKLEVRNMPQYHAGEKGPLYLALVLNDQVIDTLDCRDLDAVLKEWP